MKRKIKLIHAVLLVFVSTLLFFQCQVDKDDTSNNHPNIVLIISDDQSWPDYSFMEHEHIQTPSIDRLAKEGITFTRGYSVAPLCRPSLASIATGLYPHQHGILGNDPIFDDEGNRVPRVDWLKKRAEYNQKYIDQFQKLETIPEALKSIGYASLQTGKWWEGNYSTGGFDKGMTHGIVEKGGRHGDEGLKIGREGLDVIYHFIDSTVNSETPFFIWYAPFLPHNPHNPPDSLRNKYLPLAPTEAVANYWATIEWFDITCGQLMTFIEQRNLDEETVFIYVTDNGWIQDPDRPNRYAPRSKRTPYEMGIRTPIIFRWKNALRPEFDQQHLVSSIDIAPTIYSLCGIKSPDNLQGINILDQKALAQRDEIFAETYAHDFSTIDSSLYYRTVIQEKWKLILPDHENKPDDSPELYDLQDDPYEYTNLAAEHPELVEDLKSEIENWWGQTK